MGIRKDIFSVKEALQGPHGGIDGNANQLQTVYDSSRAREHRRFCHIFIVFTCSFFIQLICFLTSFSYFTSCFHPTPFSILSLLFHFIFQTVFLFPPYPLSIRFHNFIPHSVSFSSYTMLSSTYHVTNISNLQTLRLWHIFISALSSLLNPFFTFNFFDLINNLSVIPRKRGECSSICFIDDTITINLSFLLSLSKSDLYIQVWHG